MSNTPTTPASGSRLSPQTEASPIDWDGTEIPEEVAAHPLLQRDALGVMHEWIALRDRGRPPLDESPVVGSYQARVEFLVGAWIIDKIVPPKLGGSLLSNLQPQMLRLADVLADGGPLDAEHPREEEGRFLNGVLMPRRSSKTTSLWCVLLGRCWMRPQHMAAYTMLTLAKKAEERFALDVRDPIRRKWRDPRTSPVKVMDGKGGKGLEFPNGSRLAILAPKGDDVRSGAYDTLVLDEAGEAEAESWDDVVGAVVPSFDTRPGSQLILAGTGGKYRFGSFFWDVLHDLTAGRLRYGVPDDTPDELMESWDAGAGRLIEQYHPGLDGLTTLAQIRRNFDLLKWVRFGLEYLGHFGKDSGNDTLIPVKDWEDTTEPGAVPVGVTPLSLAFAVHPGGMWSSIAVAWYLDDDASDLARAAWALDGNTDDAEAPRAAFKIIHHQEGNARMAATLYRYVKELRLPVVYDDSPQEKAIVQDLLRSARPKPQTDIVRFGEKAVGTTRLLNGLRHRRVAHWAQVPLDESARIAVPRISGKARLIGIPESDPGQDVTGLEAAALALLRLPEAAPAEGFAPIIVA